MNRARLVSFRRHHAWCSLFADGSARCDCGRLDAVELVGWWADQARAAREPSAS